MSGAKANFSGGDAAGWRARFPSSCGWPECTCTPATGCKARAAESASEERARAGAVLGAAVAQAVAALPADEQALALAIVAERLPASPNFLHE